MYLVDHHAILHYELNENGRQDVYIYRYSYYYTTKLQQKNKKTVQEVICMSLKAIPNLPVIESFPKIPGENFNTGTNLVKKLSFKISWNHPICC